MYIFYQKLSPAKGVLRACLIYKKLYSRSKTLHIVNHETENVKMNIFHDTFIPHCSQQSTRFALSVFQLTLVQLALFQLALVQLALVQLVIVIFNGLVALIWMIMQIKHWKRTGHCDLQREKHICTAGVARPQGSAQKPNV